MAAGTDLPSLPWWLTRLTVLSWSLGLAAALVTLIFGNPLELREAQWLDQSLRWRFAAGWTPPVDPAVIHLSIDATDLRSLPTLEAEYAAAGRVVRESAALGAKVVVFDLIFVRGDAAVAAPLLAAIAEAPAKVVLAETLGTAPGAGEGARRDQLRSFPFQERVGTPAGLINIVPDRDGAMRRYSLVNADPSPQPSLALAAYLAWKGVDWTRDVRVDTAGAASWQELSEVDFATLTPRSAPASPVLLNFRAPWSSSGPGAMPSISLRQLDALANAARQTDASGGTPLRPLENKIVLVGYLATGLSDLGPTPFGTHEPLVILHSTALNDLIQGRSLRRTNRWTDALVLTGLALAFPVGAGRRRIRVPLSLWWLVGAVAMAGAGGLCLWKGAPLPPTVASLALWTLLAVVELARRHGVELLERVRLRATMAYYFSPRVLAAVLRAPGAMSPRRVEIAALLTDLRNSTPLAEALTPEEFFGLLNRVFEVQTRAVMDEDGSLEHFLGDQFLSYWGAPDAQADAAARALRGARTLIEGMEGLREKLSRKEGELFGYGVALHYGPALIGNKGSARRLDYGVMGDLINSAARVESLTKTYGALLLVTEEFYRQLSEPRPAMRRVDHIIVKGKREPLQILELEHIKTPTGWAALAEAYHQAYALYETGEFARAAEQFDGLARNHDDTASRVLAARCRAFVLDSPKEWKGIYTWQTK